MKKAFLLRGFKLGTTAADFDYNVVRDMVAAKGYEVQPFPVTWNNKTMSKYVDMFIDFYDQHKAEENIIIGHSFGAMAALIAAGRTHPNLLVLCSLSGYFKEDLPKYDNGNHIFRSMGKRRRKDFKAISAERYSKKVRDANIKTVLLYGEKEKFLYPVLYNSVHRTAKILKNARVVVVPGAEHEMKTNKLYLEKLKESI